MITRSESGTSDFVSDKEQVFCKTPAAHPLSIAAAIFPVLLTDSLYCEIVPRSEIVTTSTLAYGWQSIVVRCTASVPRQCAPLRLIAARTPHYHISEFDNTERLGWYVDTLECGHQIYVYPFALEIGEGGKKRHRCQECLNYSLPQKKPAQSVGQPEGKSRKVGH